MQFLFNHIETIIKDYKGNPPLSHFLKAYLKNHPKLGSRDRRAINECVYLYYRVVKMAPADLSVLEVIRLGIDTCNITTPFILKAFSGIEVPQVTLDINKAAYKTPLTNDISSETWVNSILTQPKLFIRLRGNIEDKIKKLTASESEFTLINDYCVALANSTKVEQILEPKDYATQDLSSQTSIEKIAAQIRKREWDDKNIRVWDACAGAGGKSLLFKELFPKADILATDIRNSSLHNFKERAQQYQIKTINMMNVDSEKIEDVTEKVPDNKEIIICDIPCSGSGTWARTPERFFFFKERELAVFQESQKTIAYNATSRLASKGLFLYITCSVFKAENEDVVADVLAKNPALKMIESGLINGIDKGADCMYYAILEKY